MFYTLILGDKVAKSLNQQLVLAEPNCGPQYHLNCGQEKLWLTAICGCFSPKMHIPEVYPSFQFLTAEASCRR